MAEEEKDIHLRTEEVNEILTATPRWILRWGNGVVLILIMVALSLSYFIKYPDILVANITLTTLNPPVTLVAKTNGKIMHMLATNKSKVQAGQVIAVVENTADYKDVIYLSETASRISDQLARHDSLTPIPLKDNLQVGELTPFYLSMLKSAKDINLYRAVNSYQKQIALLKKDLENYTSLLSKYQKQEAINLEQLKLSETDFNRDKSLFEAGAISAREFETKKKEYLSALNSNEQIRITLSNALIQINTIEKNILQLQIQDYQQQSEIKNALQQNLKALLSEIRKWKQLYMIESPVKGNLTFFNVWTSNQNIKEGDELFAVIPDKQQQFIGKCSLPMLNSGKLAIGQQVNIKLDNYPYAENGMLQGTIITISEIPNKELYSIDVSLSNGLNTTYHKTLPYKEEMKGSAEIITRKISVLDRIFFNLRKLADRQ